MRRVSRQKRLRHQMIADWRGVADGPIIDEAPVALNTLISGVLKEWHLNDPLRAEEVTAAWKEMVGPFMEKQTAPDGLKRGALTVRVLQPAIHHALRSQKVALLARLQERFGKDVVRDLKFRHG